MEEVYPPILDCDGLIVLCPNYNDAVSANLSAFINRLTALFSQLRFYDKAVFCLVVSGYSGGDIVAKQILGALNMNKTFLLPARFALLATANDPFSINRIAEIDQRGRGIRPEYAGAAAKGANDMIHLIAAVARNGVIGFRGQIPLAVAGRFAPLSGADNGAYGYHGATDL